MSNQNTNTDYLEKLYTDGEVDLSIVSEALEPYTGIDRETKNIILKPDAYKLKNELKVLIYMLAKKLLCQSGEIENESLSASEVKENTSIKDGSVDGSFKSLKDEGYITGSGSAYTVPNYQVSNIIKKINEQQQ